MRLQKLQHRNDDFMGDDCENIVVTHGVNTLTNGGEYTICGRAIPDANIEDDGWVAVGEEFTGSMAKCDCKDCLKTIRYFKRLR
jgi:hypothetical protein